MPEAFSPTPVGGIAHVGGARAVHPAQPIIRIGPADDRERPPRVCEASEVKVARP